MMPPPGGLSFKSRRWYGKTDGLASRILRGVTRGILTPQIFERESAVDGRRSSRARSPVCLDGGTVGAFRAGRRDYLREASRPNRRGDPRFSGRAIWSEHFRQEPLYAAA